MHTLEKVQIMENMTKRSSLPLPSGILCGLGLGGTAPPFLSPVMSPFVPIKHFDTGFCASQTALGTDCLGVFAVYTPLPHIVKSVTGNWL